MQSKGTRRTHSAADAIVIVDHLDHEIARVRALSDDAIEVMCTLIDARDPIDMVRKLHRFVVALASPGAVLGRAFERDPDALPGFCLDLATFRAYMARLARGTSPGQAAREVAHGRRVWLARELCEHDVPSWSPAGDVGAGACPCACPRDDDDEDGDDEMRAEIDPGAVRAELDRLLRDLCVAPGAPG